MGGTSDREWREALYRQMARHSGLPAGLRPELIKRAERCAGSPPLIVTRGGQGCKGAFAG